MKNPVIIRKLIVDERNELFDAQGMKLYEFESDYSKVREFTRLVLSDCPAAFREGNLLSQQVSELIKNGIKHGNGRDRDKKLFVWCDTRKRVRVIVEDEGEGFKDLDTWNAFYLERQMALNEGRFDDFLALASYRSASSKDEDGGNSLIAALEYWNGGMIYNAKKNKVGVLRWYAQGSGKE